MRGRERTFIGNEKSSAKCVGCSSDALSKSTSRTEGVDVIRVAAGILQDPITAAQRACLAGGLELSTPHAARALTFCRQSS